MGRMEDTYGGWEWGFPSPGRGRGAGNGISDPSWVREGASRKIPKVQGLEGF